MILGISKDFIKFFLLYACTLIAFGFGFHVLCSRKEPFSDPMESVLFTLAMMVGEFNYIDLVNCPVQYTTERTTILHFCCWTLRFAP